ncbi:MAG: TetR/AcrR family transcriptional regulator [Anaerolineales bacterium]|nr:TetR/AcrR family transcriptional regulator [Anaerolineales bacterium]
MAKIQSSVGKQRILEVAERHFIERGYGQVSIRDIANECNLTYAALYYHFESKEALFGAVMEIHVSRLKERMILASKSRGNFQEKLKAVLFEHAWIVSDANLPLFLTKKGMTRIITD